MKKYIFLFPLTILITLFYFFPVYVHAEDNGFTEFYIFHGVDDYSAFLFKSSPTPVFTKGEWNWYYCTGTFLASQDHSSLQTCIDYMEASKQYSIEHPNYGYEGDRHFINIIGQPNTVITIYGPYINNSDLNNILEPEPPHPPEPEPGETWFDNMWDWITDLLGLTDDFSEDLKNWMLEDDGGDGGHSGGHSFEIVTPSPSPSPTPYPSPTPFSVDVVDPSTGQPVYTITGIPGNTVIINQGDNVTNEGDGLDIFEVDLTIGDQGTANPRDGINSVMDSGADYVSDIDTSSVGASFSILPNDWFVLIGVLICFPFIAGFISKLLK